MQKLKGPSKLTKLYVDPQDASVPLSNLLSPQCGNKLASALGQATHWKGAWELVRSAGKDQMVLGGEGG